MKGTSKLGWDILDRLSAAEARRARRRQEHQQVTRSAEVYAIEDGEIVTRDLAGNELTRTKIESGND